MNTNLFKYICFISFALFITASANAQSDSALTFRTAAFDLSYRVNKTLLFEGTGETQTLTEIPEIEDIRSIVIYDSSVAVFTSVAGKPVNILMKDIDRVSIKDGHNIWLGIGLGTAAGALIGLIIGISSEKSKAFCGDCEMIGGLIIGTGVGGLTGGIIGAFTSGYKTYDIFEIPADIKRNKLIEIVKSFKKK